MTFLVWAQNTTFFHDSPEPRDLFWGIGVVACADGQQQTGSGWLAVKHWNLWEGQ